MRENQKTNRQSQDVGLPVGTAPHEMLISPSRSGLPHIWSPIVDPLSACSDRPCHCKLMAVRSHLTIRSSIAIGCAFLYFDRNSRCLLSMISGQQIRSDTYEGEHCLLYRQTGLSAAVTNSPPPPKTHNSVRKPAATSGVPFHPAGINFGRRTERGTGRDAEGGRGRGLGVWCIPWRTRGARVQRTVRRGPPRVFLVLVPCPPVARAHRKSIRRRVQSDGGKFRGWRWAAAWVHEGGVRRVTLADYTPYKLQRPVCAPLSPVGLSKKNVNRVDGEFSYDKAQPLTFITITNLQEGRWAISRRG
ncbi:hypothetical protein GWI33_021127 [Rhynchophorus ferrugineus]|uniref:Uncharacterized protein n=1 Tax=Rhynchophorus ferrugineus TaxID=354439 RepID=A0A834HNC6_RHYFE|nr:hypothetical protein GWI33_021127 [Rhynchophorus ferrugineus]